MGLADRVAALATRSSALERSESRYSADTWLTDYLLPSMEQFTYAGNTYTTGLRTSYGDGVRAQEISQTLPGYSMALRACPPAFAAQMVRALVISQARFTFRSLPSSKTPRKTFGNRSLAPLEHPAPSVTTGEMLARMEWHAGLAGNAYVYRQPDRLRVLRPDWTAVVFGSNMEPDDPAHALDSKIIGFAYANQGLHSGNKIHTLLPNEVAHWCPLPDPEMSHIGMSWITPAIREIQNDRAASDHKLRFYSQGATPNLVIKGLSATTKAQFDEIVEMLEARHAGVANAFRTLYLTAGADATVVGSNFKDMDLKAITGSGETRISVLSRVPAAILGISEGLAGSSLNAGNFDSARRLFADTWVYPTLQDLAGSLADIIDVPSDAELWFDTVDMPMLREDAKVAAEIFDLQVKSITVAVREGFTADSSVAATVGQNPTLLKHSGLTSVQLQPPVTEAPANPLAALGAPISSDTSEPPGKATPPGGGPTTRSASYIDENDDDEPGQFDEVTEALSAALAELIAGEGRAKYDAASDPLFEIKHPRGGRGRFRTVLARVTSALQQWVRGEGDDHPLIREGLTREHMRTVATRDFGLKVRRGAPAEEIEKQILDHVRAHVRVERDQKAEAGPKRAKFTLQGLADPAKVREIEVENKIRAAYRDLQRKLGDWVPLASVRERLAGVDRDEVDGALKRMAVQSGTQYRRGPGGALSARDREAAVRIGGDDAHVIRLEDPSDRPLPASGKHRDLDVAVYRDPQGKPALFEENDRGERGALVQRFDSLEDLERWADDNGEPRLAEWARKERGGASEDDGSAPKTPAKKATPAARAPSRGVIKATPAEAAATLDALLKDLRGVPAAREKGVAGSLVDNVKALRERVASGETSPQQLENILQRLIVRHSTAGRTPDPWQRLAGIDDVEADPRPADALGQAVDRLRGGKAPEKAAPETKATPAKKAVPEKAPAKKATPAKPDMWSAEREKLKPTERDFLATLAEDEQHRYLMGRSVGQTHEQAAKGLGPRRPAAKANPTAADLPASRARLAADLKHAAEGSAALAAVPMSMDMVGGVYRDDDFVAINGMLRGFDVGEKYDVEGGKAVLRKHVRELDKALKASRIDQPIVTWRGIGTGQSVFGPRASWPDDLSGAEWSDEAYSSTSTDRVTAEKFGAVLLRVVLPEGTPALQLSGDNDESEILLGRGQKFRVIADHGEVRKDPQHAGTARLLDVEIIPAEVEPKRPAKKATPAKRVPGKAVPAATGSDALSAAPIGQLLYGPRSASLTSVEKAAVDEYGSDGQAINEKLRRGGRLDEKTRGVVAGVDSAFGRSKLTSDVEVYRGTRSGRSAFGDLDRDLTGAEWTDAAYLSTSVDEGIAVDFARIGDAPLVMKIHAPKGVGVLALSEVPNARVPLAGGTSVHMLGQGQGEMLLERGLRLRVTKDHGQVDGVRRLDVEIVPASTSKPATLPDLTGEDLRDALDLRKVDELKAMLRERGLPVSGRKRELVDRLVEAVGPGTTTPAKAAPTPKSPTGRAPARPTPIGDLFAADDATIEMALRDVFEGKFGPYTTKVTVHITRAGTRTDKRGRVHEVEPDIGVSGKIYDANGDEIGHFSRGVSPVTMHYPDGTVRREMWANHEVVELGGGDYDENPTKYHGKGFGGEFNRRAIEWYRASGVHGISQKDHNGYVWASQGFDFRGGVVPDYLVADIRQLIADLRARKTTSNATKDVYHTIPKRFRDSPDLDQQIAAAEALLARLNSTKPGEPDYPTAYEISQLGRRSGQRGKTALWLGKLLWVSADQMILNPDQGEVISQ